MGKLIQTSQLIVGYGKRGKLLYDLSREPELKIPGFNTLYAVSTPEPVAVPQSKTQRPLIQIGNEIINPNANRADSLNAFKKAVSAPIAAISDGLTKVGTVLQNQRTGKDYTPLLHAGETFQVSAPGTHGTANLAPVSVSYSENQSSDEARANFRHMTEAERNTARTKSGAELGAYIHSLDLPSRRRTAETEQRKTTAAAFEANTDKAFQRESPEGRIIAANVTGNSAYAVGKVQNVGGLGKRTAGEAFKGRKAEREYLTERQRETVAKYAEAGDFEAVAEYWHSILPDLDAKAAKEAETKQEAFGKEHWVLSMPTQLAAGMAGAVPSTLETVAGTVHNAVTGEYRDLDPNSPAYALTAASSAQARGAEERLENQPLLSILRGGTVSAAQNLLLLRLGGGAAAGKRAFNTVLGGMALSSAGQSGYEAAKEGKSAGTALINALVSAAIETETEQLGMERWFKVLNEFDPKFVGRSLRQMARQLPAQMLVEGMEEVLANELEQTWDMLSEGDKSEYVKRIQTLKAAGMSRNEAAKEAAFELHVLRDAKAFAEAAFSTLLMDGVPATSATFREGKTFTATGKDIRANGGERAVNQTIQKGFVFAPDSPAYQAAAELQNKKTVTDKELGRLSFLNGYALADVFGTIEQRGDANARAKLQETVMRLDMDIYDKVALNDLRELVQYSRENVVIPFAEWQKSRPDMVASADANAPEQVSQLLRQTPAAPTQNENTVQRNDRETTVRVGHVTTLYHPYQGAVPSQVPNNRKSVEIPVQALENAKKNIQGAMDSAKTGNDKGFKATLKQLYKSIFQGANGVEISGLTFEGKPYLVNIGNKVIGKVINDPNVSAEKMALMEILPEVVKNGKYVGSGEYARHGAKNKPVTRYDYFETPVVSSNQNYIAAFSVEVLPDVNNFRTYEVVEMDLISVEDRLVGKEPTPLSQESSPTDSITQSAAEHKPVTENPVDKNTRDGKNKRVTETETDLSFTWDDEESANSETRTEKSQPVSAVEQNTEESASEAFEPGFDYADPATAEYARTLDRETRVRIDDLTRALGKRVRVTESVGDGIANAQIAGNEIVLSRAELERARENGGLVWQILGHELTHGVQQDAPDAYAAFREAALKASIGKGTVREHAADIRKLYEMRGIDITEEAALDEAIADYGGQLMRDTDTAERFIERNRRNKSLLEKVRDAIVNLVRKLTGAEKKQVQTVQGLFDAALDTAAQAVRDSETAAQKDSGTKFSLKEFSDGTRFVDVQADQKQFEGLSLSEKMNLATRIIKEKFAGKVIGLDNRVFVNGRTAKEYARPSKFLDDDVLDAKLRASGELDNIMDAGTNFRNQPDGLYGHKHPDVVGGFDYFDTIFKVGDEYYSGVINVANIKNGKLLKDVTKIRNITQDIASSYGTNPKSDFLRNASMSTITQTAAESKGETKFSLSGTEDAERLAALVQRNQELETELEQYQKRLAEAKTLSGARQNYAAAQVRTITADFLKNWHSTLSVNAVAPDVAKLINHIKAGPNGTTSKEASPRAYQAWVTETEEQARDIARRVIESALEEVNTEEKAVIREFGAELRGARIAYDDLKAEMGKDFEAWRRRNQFRMGLRKNGRSVDSYWADWNQRYGNMYFPLDITAPADMLRHLEALLDSGLTEYANPFACYDTLEVTEACKEFLLHIVMNTDAPADAKTIRDNAYQKGVEKGREYWKPLVEQLVKVENHVKEERARGEQRLKDFRERQSKLREQRIETAKKNAVRRRVEAVISQLNHRNMSGGERAFLNSIFRNLDAIAKEELGIGADELLTRLDSYWEKIDEGSEHYDEEFLKNPFQTLDAQISMAEAANERKLTSEQTTDLKRDLSGLNAGQLRRIADFLGAFNTAQQNRNALIASTDSRSLSEQAVESMEHVRKAQAFRVPFVEHMTRPLTFFRALTGYRTEGDALTRATEQLQAGERARDDYQRRGYDTVLSRFAAGLGYANIQNMSVEQRQKAVRAVSDALRTLSGKEADLIEIHGVDPTTLENVTAYITKGMRAALYMHSQNEDNLRHIRYGGFVVPGVEASEDGKTKQSGWDAYRKGNYAQAYTKNRQHVRLTLAEVQEITQNLTKEEKALADAAAFYYDQMSKPELSFVHLKLKGWSPFHVENYFPIETDEMFRAVDYETMRPDGTLGTPGFSRERVKAGNPILLRDLNLVLLTDISRHSRFIGLAIPVRNMNKLLNWRRSVLPDNADTLRMAFNEADARAIERRADEIRERAEKLRKENPSLPPSKFSPLSQALYELKGRDGAEAFREVSRSNAMYQSLKDTISARFGDKATEYIARLMRDMTGTGQDSDALGRVLSTLTGNYAGAVLTLNTSTALVQTASYPTAAAILGAEPLLKAFAAPGRVDLNLVNTYTSRLWERSQGYTTYERETLSANKSRIPVSFRKAANWIQGMDVATTTQLWKACQVYVDEQNAQRRQQGIAPLERGTPEQIAKGQSEYYRAVADLYNRVLEQTQPSYGVMERPQVLRSKNALVRLTNMFKTQMYQNFNILYDAFGELGARQRDYAASNNAETEAALQQARQGLGRALVSQIGAALLAVLIKSGFGLFTGDDDKYRDKDGNLNAGSYGGGVLRGTVATFPGFVAYGSEAYSVLASAVDTILTKVFHADPLFRETFYGLNFSAFGQMTNAVTRTESALGSLVSALSAVAQGLDDEKTDWRGLGQKLLSAASDWAMFAGFPARNLTKLFYGFVRNASKLALGDTAGTFATRKLLSTTFDSEIRALLYQALADGDLELYKRMAEDVQRDFRTANGERVTGKTVRDSMLSMWRTEEKTKGVSRLGQAARDYIGAIEQYSADTPEKFTEGDLSPEQYRAYRDEYEQTFQTLSDSLNRSAAVRTMDDKQRVVLIRNAASLAVNLSLEHHSGGKYTLDTAWMRWASGGKDYDVTADMALLFKAAYDAAESEKDTSGNTVVGSRKRAALDTVSAWLPDISWGQLAYLQSFYWNPDVPELAALKENGYRH